MTQESISASSKYWDNKSISLTETTKKNIMKKAYMLDAETMFSQYKLEGEDAVNAAKQNNITEEQLVENTNTYTFLGFSAINDLEANASKDSRIRAVVNLTKLGYTNIYDSNSQNFVNPPDEPDEEKPEAPAQEPEEESRYQYLRRNRPVQQVQQMQPVEQTVEQVQPEAEPSSIATLRGAARFIPNAVRQHLPLKGEKPVHSVRPVTRTTSFVQINPRLAPQRQPPQQRPAQREAPQQTQPRSLMNREVALKLGGARINPVAPARQVSVGNERVKPQQRVKVSPRFGLSVRR